MYCICDFILVCDVWWPGGREMKILINTSKGGLYLSTPEIIRYAEIKKVKVYPFYRKLFANISDNLIEGIDPDGYGSYNQYFILDPKMNWWEPGNMFAHGDLDRTDPDLHQLFQEYKTNINGNFCDCILVDIPDSIIWHIASNEDREWVAEDHRIWDEYGEGVEE